MATKTTKRALLVSVLSLFICFTMLIGTTYAWFTDSVTSAGNIIKTGTLDVSLEYKTPNGISGDWVDASTGAIFNHDNWEPGYTQVRYVKIENKGSLDLEFVLNIIPNTATAPGEVNLADVIEVYMMPVTDATNLPAADRTALTTSSTAYKGTLAAIMAENDGAAHGVLYAKDNADAAANKNYVEVYAIVLKMSESAGNEYQNKSVGGGFVVQLLATQLASESDDLGTDYDDKAEYPEVNMGVANKAENVETTVVANDADSNEQVVGVTVPANAPAGEYALEVTNVQTKTDDNGNTTLYMDINLKCDGVKVTADGNIVYTVSVDVGAGLNLTKVVHDGEKITEFEYNVATGIITFDTADFSPFAFTYDNGKAANDVVSLAELVAAGGIIQLSENVVLKDAPLVITKDTVLNLNGYTLSGKSTSDKASYLISVEKGASLMIQNGTVSFYATTPDTEWGGEGQPAFPGYANNTIKATGALVVNGAKIENLTEAGGASYAIDCYPGADVVINDGSVIDGHGKIAIRMFANSDKDATNVTINGGTVTGHRAVWVQLPGNKFDNKMIANLTVNGGTLVATDKEYNLAIYSYSYGNSFANTNITLNGGVFNGDIALGGGANKADTENFTAKWDNCEFNGAYGVYRYVANDGVVSYVFVSDEAELRAALAAGNVAVLKNDINVDADNTITVNNVAAIDLNGKTLAGVSDQTGANRSIIVVDKNGELIVKNGTVTMEHKGDNMAWNNSTNALEAVSGGKLTIVDAKIVNLGGSDMAYGVNIGNNGGATLTTVNTTIESKNYVALRVFNNADGAIKVDLTEGSKLIGEGSPFFVHFWSEADLGAKQAARQAYLTVNFNDTEVSRYSGSKSLVRFGFTDAIYYSSTDMTEVVAGNEKAFTWALAQDKNVLFNSDLSFTGVNQLPDRNNYVEVYGNKTGFAQYGGVIDGNGYELIDAEIDRSYVIVTHGGTIKNLVIKTGARGIVTYSPTEDVYIDNVVVDGAGYAINSTEHGAVNMFITNSTVNGWTSIAGFKKVELTKCKLGENSAKYWQGMGYDQDYDRLFRVYSPTFFNECEFEQGYYLDMSAGGTATLTNCTVNDVVLTADNYADYITIELPSGKTLADCVTFKN